MPPPPKQGEPNIAKATRLVDILGAGILNNYHASVGVRALWALLFYISAIN